MAEPSFNVSDVNCAESGAVSAPTVSANSEPPPWLATLLTAVASVNKNASAAPFPEDFHAQFALPTLDPLIDDVNQWIEGVEDVGVQLGWDDRKLLVHGSGYLAGSAKRWYNTWRPPVAKRNWSEFKSAITTAFPRRRNSGELLKEAVLYTSGSDATYDEYARQKIAKLTRIDRSWIWPDHVLIECVCDGIADPTVKTAVINSRCTTIKHLIDLLAGFRKTRNSVGNNTSLRTSSRLNDLPRVPSNRKTCFKCGSFEHFQASCPRRAANNIIRELPNPAKRPRINMFCTFCEKTNHNIDKCFAHQRLQQSNRNVNCCSAKFANHDDVIVGVINGFAVNVLIDTGAQVSLITEEMLHKTNYQTRPLITRLTGLGRKVVFSTTAATLLLELPGVSLEILFRVVANEALYVPVVLGTDVLNRPGIVYERKLGVIRLRDENNMNRINVISEHFASTPLIPVTELTGRDHEVLLKMLYNFSDIISTGNAVSSVNTGVLKIRLKSDEIVRYQPYRLSFAEREIVKSIVSDLTKNGIIRESSSAYASPILLVKKKDNSNRMVVDYRALNKLTIKDRYPLPRIEDQIDRLGHGKYFTSLDMTSGFHQIPIDPESIEKTAFVTPDGQYEYVQMPYGLCNGPPVYQRAINKALAPLVNDGRVLVYIDDVLIPSTDVESGMKLLNEVLIQLRKAGFSINIKKCKFLMSSIEYLGRVISKNGVQPSPSKVIALRDAPAPSNAKEVRQFLGLAGYFRRFIYDYARRISCITKLTRQNEPFEWGEEQECVRKQIIGILTSSPVLRIFDPTLETELHSDASAVGYGAILFQKHNKTRYVVAYYSRATQGAERNYHSYQLETLAVYNALKHFRHYLIGINFKIVTDCNALRATQNKRDLQPRVIRMWTYLQDFCFTIEYRKGAKLGHADYLSRNPLQVGLIKTHCATPENWLKIQQLQDDEVQAILQQLRDNELDANRYVERDGYLFHISCINNEKVYQWYVPKQSRLGLLRIFHDEQMHIGYDKTYEMIRKYFWFPRLSQFVKKYLKHCLICNTHKRRPRQKHPVIFSIDKKSIPFDTLHADYLGPLTATLVGDQFILVFVDSYSKYCLLFPCIGTSAEEFKGHFKTVLSLFGTPTRLIVDNGSAFKSKISKKWLEEWNVEVHAVTPYVHRANGQVERYMRTIANLLRVEGARKSEWTNGLWKIQLIINTTPNKTTGMSPLQLLLDCDNTIPLIRSVLGDLRDVKHPCTVLPGTTRQTRRQLVSRRLQENARRQENRTNSKAKRPQQFQRGDFVLLYRNIGSNAKMDSDVKGPYRIVNCLGHNRYTLEKLNSHSKTSAVAEDLLLWPVDWTPEDCAFLFLEDDELQEPIQEAVQGDLEMDDVPFAQRLEMLEKETNKSDEDLLDDMPLLQRLQLEKISQN